MLENSLAGGNGDASLGSLSGRARPALGLVAVAPAQTLVKHLRRSRLALFPASFDVFQTSKPTRYLNIDAS